jgi:predicted ATP-dependent serine protease
MTGIFTHVGKILTEVNMINEELIQRSPIRILEKSIHGGLKAGEIGAVASQRGVGKTSVLVQVALDKLLQGKKSDPCFV